MNTPWYIAVISAGLTSGVVAALASAFVNARFTHKRAELDFRRKKLEELYTSLDWYCFTLIGFYGGSRDENYVSSAVLELIKKPETVQECIAVGNKIQMLIALYFRCAESRWHDVKGILDRIADLHYQLTENPDLKDAKGNSLNIEFVNLLLFFNKVRIDFLEYLAKHGKALKVSL